MKKRRILFAGIISVLSLVISACDFLPSNFFPNNNNQESSQRSRSSRNTPSSSKEHVHRFSEEWDYNSKSHWHNATCGHVVKSELGSHQFYSVIIKEPTCSTMGTRVDMCTICDYQQTVYIEKSDHNWQEYNRVEPTCCEPGVSKRFCATCGIYEDLELPPLGHDFVNIYYQLPTCTQVGFVREQCTRCNEINEYYLPQTEHVWNGTQTYHGGYEGNSPYYTENCVYCGATRIVLRTVDGVINGNIKAGIAQDYGYIKLANNGGTISFTFDYPSNAYGTLYQHGLYDNWNNGSAWGYNYHYTSSGYDYNNFNFSVDVNGQPVDMFGSADISYYDFLNGGQIVDDLYNNGYSPVADCIIGNISLVQGQNAITYTRLNSYSLYIDYFTLVIQNSDHVHTVSNYWEFDDNYHWHRCTDPYCPIGDNRFETANHTFDSQIISQPTCQNCGIQRDTCVICGYSREIYLPTTDHDYQSVGSFTNDGNSVLLEEYRCSYCGENALRWNAMDYDQEQSMYVDTSGGNNVRFQSNMAENLNGQPVTGSHIIYKINSPTDVYNVGLAFKITQSSGSAIFDVTSSSASSLGYIYDAYGNLTPATKKFGLRVNNVEIQLGDDPYGMLNVNNATWFNWPVSFNLYAGPNTIDIYCLSSSYRARMYEFQITGIPYIQPTHTHASDGILQYDGNTHFYLCSSGDGARLNEEPHQFGEFVTILEPTCTEYGQIMRTCSVCGYQEYQNISPNGHVWDAGFDDNGATTYTCVVCGATKTMQSPMNHVFDETRTWYGVNSENVEYTMRYCIDCEKEIQSIPFANGNILSGGYSSGKLTSGTTMSWKFPARSMGLIKIYIPCKMTAGNTRQTYNPSLYNISVNGVNAPILMPEGTYDELGIGSSETKYFKWAEIDISNFDLPNGEIEIQFTSNVSSYRMIFDGEMRIEY